MDANHPDPPAQAARAEDAPPAPAEERPAWPSAARQVTLFEDRAEVVRVARVPVEAGARWVAIASASGIANPALTSAKLGIARPSQLRMRLPRKKGGGYRGAGILVRSGRLAQRESAAFTPAWTLALCLSGETAQLQAARVSEALHFRAVNLDGGHTVSSNRKPPRPMGVGPGARPQPD